MKLTLPLAPSANAMWRSIARVKRDGTPFVTVALSKDGRQFKKDAASWLVAQRTEVLTGEVSVKITVWFPNRRGDLDNRIKPVLDVLTGVCYYDDSQVVHLEVGREISEKPRTVVVVEPFTPDLFSADKDLFAFDVSF